MRKRVTAGGFRARWIIGGIATIGMIEKETLILWRDMRLAPRNARGIHVHPGISNIPFSQPRICGKPIRHSPAAAANVQNANPPCQQAKPPQLVHEPFTGVLKSLRPANESSQRIRRPMSAPNGPAKRGVRQVQKKAV